MSDKKMTPEEYRRRLQALVHLGKMTEEQLEAAIEKYKREYEQIRQQADTQRSQRPQGARGPGRPRQQAQAPSVPSWSEVRKHAHSAYAFVPLNEHIQMPETDWLDDDGNLRSRCAPLPTGCCAEIGIRIIPETPICIGQMEDGVVVPARLNGDTRWVIPGSTLRGYFRAFLQTLAFGRLWPFNFRQSFGLRDFMHPYYSGDIGPAVSKATEVRAGWLQQAANGEWRITPCKRWGYINIEKSRHFDWPEWLTKSRAIKYSAFRMFSNDRKTFDFSGETARRVKQVSDRVGIPVYDLDDNGKESGYLVFAGPFPLSRKGPNKRTKRYEYIFFDGNNDPVVLKPDTVKRFKAANGRMVGNKIKPQGGWADFEKTLKQGKRVPVFYVGDLDEQGPDFAFGFTRMFKVNHRFSVGDKAEETNSAHLPAGDVEERDDEYVFRPDFVENLFGYVLEPEHLRALNYNYDPDKLRNLQRRGRVFFGFAFATDDAAFRQSDEIKTIIGGPQPSFAPFYLTGKIKDWSHPDTRLAGRKRYVPRYRVAENARADIQNRLREQVTKAEQASKRDLSDNVFTRLRFLAPEKEGAAFEGCIRLFNVTPVELGALLWALTFGGDDKYRHMLGHAKPFGAGQVRIEVTKLTVRPNAPDADAFYNGLPPEGADIMQRCAPFMRAFENFMKDAWAREPKVKDCLLAACDPGNWGQWRGYPEFPKGFADLRKALQWLKDENPEQMNRRLAGVPEGALLPACSPGKSSGH